MEKNYNDMTCECNKRGLMKKRNMMSEQSQKITGYVFVNYTQEYIAELKHNNEKADITLLRLLGIRIADCEMKITQNIPAKNLGGASDLTIFFEGSDEQLDSLYTSLQEFAGINIAIKTISIHYDLSQG